MEDCNLPTGTAKEPEEEAHLSQKTDDTSPNMNKQRKGITFAEATESTENSTSQSSGAYKNELSQLPDGLTHRQRLLWLQKRRTPGLWVQCDDCDRWRYLPHVLDAHELPDKWCCSMNPGAGRDHEVPLAMILTHTFASPTLIKVLQAATLDLHFFDTLFYLTNVTFNTTDKTASSCSVPETPIRLHEEEDLIHGEYAAGSVVWARMAGWPWWPAMVDDCPDTEQYYWLDGFSDIPTHYNVVFFDAFDVTRAWIAPEHLMSFGFNRKNIKTSKDKRYRKRLEVAIRQAEDANKMTLNKRLAKYSFIARYPGSINQPKKISKNELKKFQNKLKRKYNIEFPNESGTSDNDEHDQLIEEDTTTVIKKGNSMLLVGTPRSSKEKKRCLRNGGTETKITKNIIKDNLNMKEPQDLDNFDNESTSENFKQPSSLAVQFSNTVTSTVADGSIDNDTSATFVPESERENDILHDIAESVARVPSPGSDDFDF